MIVIGININTIDTTNRNIMIKNIPPGIQLKKAFQRKALLKNPFLKFNEKNTSTTNNKNGKLRFLYEALPFAKIFHTANGDSWNENTNLLNTTINNIHQKIPVYLGTKKQIQII